MYRPFQNIALPQLVLIASLGLLPASADAQEPPRSETFARSSARSETRIESDRNGRRLSVAITNGDLVRVTLDGEALPADRVRRAPGVIEILDESGEVLERLEVGPERLEVGPERQRAWTPPMPGNVVDPSMGRTGAGAGSVDAARAPKSMMGVGLGEVDASLAVHLEVDRRRSTMLTNVAEGMPAGKAGLRRYDVITSINGSPDASPEALRAALRELEPGAKVSLGYRRCGVEAVAEVEVVAFDPEKLAAIEGFEPAIAVADADQAIERWIFSGPGEESGGEIFFFGPDGQRREVRVPGARSMPPMPNASGGMAFDTEALERSMRELRRGLEEMNERLERGWREERRAPERDRGMPDDARRVTELEERMRRLERMLETALDERLGDKPEAMRQEGPPERLPERLQERRDRTNAPRDRARDERPRENPPGSP